MPVTYRDLYSVLCRRRVLFWSLYSLPVASVTVAASIQFHLFPTLFTLTTTFALFLLFIRALETGFVETKHGRYDREKSPFGYWCNIAVGWLTLLFIIAFPVGYALQEARKISAP